MLRLRVAVSEILLDLLVYTSMEYRKLCQEILNLDPKIRFAGVCDDTGETKFGGQREGVKNLLSPEETKKSNENQRHAIENIFTGKAKGEGPFAIFAGTFKFVLEPQYVDIKAKIDGRKSSFSVPGIIDVQVENFINPVTGEEQDTKIQIPKRIHIQNC